MFYALSWAAVFSLLALWSLAVWVLHGIAVWTVSHAGALKGAASGVDSLRLPEWLAPWIPPETVQAMTAWVADLAPVVDSVLRAVPLLADGLTVVSWGVWGLGTVLLVLLGAGLHVLIAVWRGHGGSAARPPRSQVAA